MSWNTLDFVEGNNLGEAVLPVENGGSNIAQTGEAMEAAALGAESRGYTVYRGDPRTLLLDLDDKRAQDQYARILPIMFELYGAREAERWETSPGKIHVVVKLDGPHRAHVRCGMQAILGSDQVKEALSLRRLKNGILEPSLLFRPPQFKVKV